MRLFIYCMFYYQATQLLQARKSEEDVTGICDMCDKLRVSQIIKILNVYTPADEFEERVSPAFVRKIRTKLQVGYLQKRFVLQIWILIDLFIYPYQIILCIPQSFNTNILDQLFYYKIIFVNSQHDNTNSKGDFVLKNWF